MVPKLEGEPCCCCREASEAGSGSRLVEGEVRSGLGGDSGGVLAGELEMELLVTRGEVTEG